MDLTVVIAIKNGEAHVSDCLGTVLPQLRAGDEVVVVDDNSDDETALRARLLGARVIALEASLGPYGARSVGASTGRGDGLIFFDVRCRARAGWLDRHRELLSQPGTVLSGSSVLVQRGSSLASQVAHCDQPFLVSNYWTQDKRYFPACNLGVARDAYNRAGGFGHGRSGLDALLCWAVLDLGLGGIAYDEKIWVDWVPRSTLRQLFEQYHRYGQSAKSLGSTNSHHQIFTGTTGVLPSVNRVLRAFARGLIKEHAGVGVGLGLAGAQLAFELGYAGGHLSEITRRFVGS